jgi:hypothetical protein
MAKWNQQALEDWNKGITASGMTRAQATTFGTRIEAWADAVLAFQERRFNAPVGRGFFEVRAENAEVISVTYDTQ